MSNEDENKDAIIRQQQLIIEDQHRQIAFLNEHSDIVSTAKCKPFRFLAWVLLRDIIPFKYLWRIIPQPPEDWRNR